MARTILSWVALACGIVLSSSATLSAADARPNIVILVADDLGYADIGCHGGKEIPTPHIDSIAAAGVRCTSGYVSGPYCSPTRAGLLTGRYQQRFGHEFNPGPPTAENANFGLSLKETTLPQRLKEAGYATGMVGKWHLGHKDEFHPLSRGFQEFYGFLGGSHTYFNEQKKPNDPIMRGREAIAEPEYLTDAFQREAVAYIDRHQKEPFFLYMTFNAVHTPMDATDKYLARFSKIEDPKRRAYAAMLSAMDDAIGAIVGKLKATGIEDNTLVFFISDNGGPTAVNTGLNTPLSGVKAQTAEGGIRVPYLVQWKKKLPAGKIYDVADIAADPHYQAREMILESQLPDGTPVKLPGVLPKLSASPGQVSAPAPTLGQHTDEVLSAMGVAPETLADWRARGII